MKSEVFLRTQIGDILNGLAVAINGVPAAANTEVAAAYNSGYLAAINAVAVSVGIGADDHPQHPEETSQ